MNRWVPIRYRDFWDVPRIFLAEYRGVRLLFDCPFDEDTEDYADAYRVYVMPELAAAELEGSWKELPRRATRLLGVLPVRQVAFDPTRRKEVDAGVLDELLSRARPASNATGP